MSQTLEALPAIRNDDDTNVCRHLDDLQDRIGTSKVVPRPNLRTGGKDLGDLIAVGEVQDLLRHVITFKDEGLNVEVASEIQVLLDGFPSPPRINSPFSS